MEAGARTVSVRSASGGGSNRRIFKSSLISPAASRDGSRSNHFKLDDRNPLALAKRRRL
jgi:hypothetical protein